MTAPCPANARGKREPAGSRPLEHSLAPGAAQRAYARCRRPGPGGRDRAAGGRRWARLRLRWL